MKVAEAVGRTLAGLGADHVFGVVGSGNFHVTNAVVAGGARFVAARHECGAATMADAYARTSGRLGVLSVHQGCGLTNALTGIAEAAKSRTPMVVLAAEATSPLSNFHVDQCALAESVGAVAERVSVESAADDVVRAVRRAVHERRTVLLNLPLDVQAADAALSPVSLPPAAPSRPDPAGVAALAEALAAARRPVFIAGRGARDARRELEWLAARCGALLATSAVGHGLFAGNPWSLGISGGFATPLAASLVADADLVVGWGCALNMWTTRHDTLISDGTKVAQVDLDAAASGAHRPVDIGVVGDVGAVAAAVDVADSPGYRDPALAD
ncbi:MAG TPA: thiamine pyrophosphate-binding protein, partial [Pseudonocardiaceae bacterium]|nr:thiamine pyrophosphate-binding protein [Pseudonocardiaceae bacterium]